MSIKSIKTGLFITALGLFMASGQAFGATAATGNCNTSDVTSAAVCIGGISNPSKESENWFNSYSGGGAFGITGWQFAEKIQNGDGGLPVRETSIDIGLIVDPTIDGEQASGTWGFYSDLFSRYENVALVLKAGRGFSAYLLSGAVTTGEWNITGWTGQGLSHASVYVTGKISAVPLPPSLLLFVPALLAGFGLSRRQSPTQSS